jgi:hypothetical protein
MKKILPAALSATLVLGTGLALASPPAAGPSNKDDAMAQWSQEGLQQIKVKGLDVVYARPGAKLSGYRKIMVDPVTVAFQREFERETAIDTRTRRHPEDMNHLRDELAQVVRHEVESELGRAGYQIVDQPGADVLEVNVRVADLFLNAPDLPTTSITRAYTMRFGEMTLVADLRDASSGDSLMRILDRTVGRDYESLRITTRVENAAEVRRVANAWARAVRRELDAANPAGGRA